MDVALDDLKTNADARDTMAAPHVVPHDRLALTLTEKFINRFLMRFIIVDPRGAGSIESATKIKYLLSLYD